MTFLVNPSYVSGELNNIIECYWIYGIAAIGRTFEFSKGYCTKDKDSGE